MAPFFATLNASALTAAFETEHLTGRAVLTFSHFLPERALHRGYNWLGHVEGSDCLGEQVRGLRPDVHVFGHTHWNLTERVGATRFVQHPLGYPRERQNEGYRLRTSDHRPAALAWDCHGGASGATNSRAASLPASMRRTFATELSREPRDAVAPDP